MVVRHAAVEADRADGKRRMRFSNSRESEGEQVVAEWLMKAEEMLVTFAATDNRSVNVAAQQLGCLSNSWQFRFDAEWLIGTIAAKVVHMLCYNFSNCPRHLSMTVFKPP
jgi:hypothetical protein